MKNNKIDLKLPYEVILNTLEIGNMITNKIYACEIHDKKYVAILETLGWKFYKIVGDSTMNTKPTRGIQISDCRLWVSKDAEKMGKNYLQLKFFLNII